MTADERELAQVRAQLESARREASRLRVAADAAVENVRSLEIAVARLTRKVARSAPAPAVPVFRGA